MIDAVRPDLRGTELWARVERHFHELHGPGFGPVAEVAVDGDRAPVVALGRAAARCSTGDVELEDGAWRPVGDVMEAALVALALRLGLDPDEDRAHRPDLRRYPFDPQRRRMSVVAGRPDGSGAELLVKGGPDAVLGRCRGDTAAARAEVERRPRRRRRPSRCWRWRSLNTAPPARVPPPGGPRAVASDR